MGRWRDAVSPVRDGEVRRTPKGSLTGLLKQSVAGLVGQSQDPSSPGKGKRLSWFGLGSRRSPAPEEDPGPSSDGDIEGGARGSRVRGGSESSTAGGAAGAPAMPGSTAEEFAVASQLLEGLYGQRLEASKAMEILSTVPEISWLVECYCMTPAQPGWRKSKTAPGDVPLYADEASGKVYEAMPCIRHYMRMAELSLTARNVPEKADAAAAQLHHYVQSLQKELKAAEAAWTGPHEDSESQGATVAGTLGNLIAGSHGCTLFPLDKGLYGAALLMPQLARSAGYPKNLVILCLRSYIFLAVNYVCQVLVLYMIAKEELIWDAFAGQMFLCDFGRNAGDCPNGPDCVGPGATDDMIAG
eukprot:s875_g5.t1